MFDIGGCAVNIDYGQILSVEVGDETVYEKEE